MIRLGTKNQIVGAEHWAVLPVRGRPEKMPKVFAGYEVVGGVDFGDGEVIFACETLEHMKALYDRYIAAHGIAISWYQIPAAEPAATS